MSTIPSPNLSLIVAMAANRTIGLNNTLPWRLPADLQHFKQLTMGHHMIMGRKTFESIGRLLPGRTSVIITRNPDFQCEGAIIANSLENAIAACPKNQPIFITGGGEIYKQALPLVSTMYITEVHADIEGDAFFPEFSQQEWQEISREQQTQTKPQALAYDFVTYQRISTQK